MDETKRDITTRQAAATQNTIGSFIYSFMLRKSASSPWFVSIILEVYMCVALPQTAMADSTWLVVVVCVCVCHHS